MFLMIAAAVAAVGIVALPQLRRRWLERLPILPPPWIMRAVLRRRRIKTDQQQQAALVTVNDDDDDDLPAIEGFP